MQYQCAQAIGWMTTETCYREEERKGERVRGRMRKEEKKEENISFILVWNVISGVCGIFTYLILKPTLKDDIISAVEMRNQKLAG